MVVQMDKDELTGRIETSAKNKNVLRIKYTDLKDQASIRNVEPYEIRGDKLWAYCRKRKSIRQFDLNRIQQANVTKYTYFPKWPIKIGNDPLEKTASSSSYTKWLYQIGNQAFGSYYNSELE
jgi:predicted DNA-binding transcriptional regulator YafY